MRTRVRFRVWDLNWHWNADGFDARSRRPAQLENPIAGLQSGRLFDGVRNGSQQPAALRLRTFNSRLVRGAAPPSIMKPQPFSVGVFSCPIAPVPACSWGFLRKPADCTGQPSSPFRATFHSLLAIPRSDLAPWNWPEVRKGRNAGPYRSKGYARTNQAVGLLHRGAKEPHSLCFVGTYLQLPT